MVAFTATYALPYQEGTDEPCDAPEVWCELAALANTAMGATKALLDRVEPAVPAALVARVEPLVVGPSTSVMVPFDTVHLDTDGLVNPDRSNVFVFPQRTGLYRVVANMAYTNTGAAPTDAQAVIIIATSFVRYPLPAGLSYTQAAADSSATLQNGFNNFFRTTGTSLADQTFLDSSSTNAGGYGLMISPPITGTITITAAQLGVYYLREVP